MRSEITATAIYWVTALALAIALLAGGQHLGLTSVAAKSAAIAVIVVAEIVFAFSEVKEKIADRISPAGPTQQDAE